MQPKSPKDYKWIRNSGLAFGVGAELVAPIVVGYFIGAWLDGKFRTDPWLMIVFTFIGIGAGFVNLFRLVSKISKDD
ncbi:MAG: AtpZ/AtpI family protein [Armatimonadetes bacterium]|nr:AtpZ/AtpI family protein [Armatimonadota bacterium]